MTPLAIKIPRITPDQFWEICQANQELRLELTASGEVIAMPPTHSWTGKQNSGLIAQLWNWNEQIDPTASVRVIQNPCTGAQFIL